MSRRKNEIAQKPGRLAGPDIALYLVNQRRQKRVFDHRPLLRTKVVGAQQNKLRRQFLRQRQPLRTCEAQQRVQRHYALRQRRERCREPMANLIERELRLAHCLFQKIAYLRCDRVVRHFLIYLFNYMGVVLMFLVYCSVS